MKLSGLRTLVCLALLAPVGAIGCDEGTTTSGSDAKADVLTDADASKDATPDTKPDSGPDAKADATPDAEPDATPDAEPDATPDAEPDVTPDAEPDVTPVACTDNAGCADAEFCAKADGCEGEGVCEARPELCPLVFAPVCGCDDETYGNECEARSAGVNVAHEGPCKPCPVIIDCAPGYVPVDTDGDGCADACAPADCSANADCPESMFCDKETCDGKGVCAAKPQACPEYYSPVCGCDGATYDNPCFAEAAGTNVAYEGQCKPQCGTIAGIPCDDGQFCEFAAGACLISDNGGTCVDVPQDCPDVWMPVCGCDGNTYSNDCDRQAAQVQKDHDGACECLPILCEPGTVPTDTDGDGCDDSCVAKGCETNADCGKGNYCAKKGCDGPGTCAPKPDACIQVYDPVCGCDGKTYGNACSAASAGVNVAYDGECTTEACGGFAGTPCAAGEYCEFPAGSCQWADQLGACVTVPDACPDVWDPVCGCDGVTYGNDCERQAAMAQKDHDGPCKVVCDPIKCPAGTVPTDTDGDGCDDTCAPSGGTCGGIQGIVCPGGSFCEWPVGTCDWADQQGECQEIPEACTKIYAPVCGCDGQTYANDCMRRMAGVSKDHDGTCECLIIIDCAPGYVPVDTDGDGCADACEPASCTANADCSKGSYCAKESCDGEGKCTPMPTACTKEYAPVCGCDGVTYGNDCMAAAAGVNVAASGACQSDICGTIAGLTCGKGEFCEFAPGTCDILDNGGTCEPVPDACPEIYAPVCGCDGNTYGNDCERQAAMVSKDHNGKCGCDDILCPLGQTPVDTDGDGCADTCEAAGCNGNKDCADSEYCAKKGCGGAGTCTPKPQGCTLEYDPVCGCDGKTYGNACAAASAGVNVASKGECAQACGGFLGVPCEPGEFCDLPAGLCSGADLTGTCAAVPDVCPDFLDPVCGCDGVTYGNDCERQAAMVQKDHDGACVKVTPK